MNGSSPVGEIGTKRESDSTCALPYSSDRSILKADRATYCHAMSKCCCCTDGPSLADDPRVIFSIYFIAFIPLAFIYALDFITEKWRPIRNTRRNGMIQLFVSLPSLGCIIYYIDLQIKDSDYKEAAAAITVAVFNSYHVLRTIWGLVLLYEFRNWNISALRCLVRLGYHAPRYEYSDDVNNVLSEMKACRPLFRLADKLKTSFRFVCSWLFSWRQSASPSSVSTEPNSSSSAWTDDMIYENRTCSSRLSTALQFMKICGSAFYNWVMGNMEEDEFSSAESLVDIERTVDYHMVVNSSLIDNEFSNAELPVRLVPFSRVRHSDPERHSAMARIVASFLKSTKREECSGRWLVSFLARFGYQWLQETRGLGLKDSESGTELQRTKRKMSQHLAIIVSAHTTQGSVENNGSTEKFVTLFPPHHRYCTGYKYSNIAPFKVTERCMLPFKMNGRFDETLYFSDLEATIRDAAKDDWHKTSLNKLYDEQRTAVENVTPQQLLYFASLMEIAIASGNEDDWVFGENGETVNWGRENARLNTLMYQLGNDIGEDQEEFLQPLPVQKEVLSYLLWETNPNCLMLQTSVHVDNCLALEYGDRHGVYLEENNGHSHVGEPELTISVFQKQYDLEMKRLRLGVGDPGTNMFEFISQDIPRFIGSVAETVRSILASWVAENDAEAGGWYASIAPVGIRFLCSKQLCSEFAKAETIGLFDEDMSYLFEGERRSFCMRLVWEVQAHLHWRIGGEVGRKVEDIRQSPFLIMLFILGFPALKMERTKDEWASSDSSHGNETIEFEDGIIVKPVAGPQELHILFTCDQESETMSVIFCPECPVFNWQGWKDAVMGRLTAKKDWRLSRLFSRNELLRTEANHSDICSPVKYIAPATLGKDYGLRYWSGWSPFMPQIAEFEVRNLVEEKYGVSNSEVIEHNSIEFIGALNAAMDIHFQVGTMYLDGHQAMEEGRVDDALKLFGRCIGEHGHKEALEDAFGLVIRRSPVCDTQLGALGTAMDAQFKNLVNRSHTKERERRVDEIDLAMLSDYFGRIFEQTSSEDALKKRALALFYKNGANNVVSEEAIQAIEAFIAYEGERIQNSPLLFYLVIAHHSRFLESKDPAEQKIAAKYLQRSGDLCFFDRGGCFALNVGYLLEKGCFVGRDAERKNAMIEILCEEVACGDEKMLRAMVDRLFVKPSASEEGKNEVDGHERVFGIGAHPKHAMALYEKLYGDRFESKNRLGLIYHKGASGVSANALAAEEQYSDAIEEGNEDALCNMGVLKCGTTGHEAGMSYLKGAVEGGSSTGMNNLAVAYELGRGVNRNAVEAERLYKKAIEVDSNPIAIYNLAVWYMWGDPEARNGERISESQSMISELIAPETELESLYTLQDQVRRFFLLRSSETEPVLLWRVELEELDDCLGYVKMLENGVAEVVASDQESVEACI